MTTPTSADEKKAEAPKKLEGTPFELGIDDTGINGAGIRAELLPATASSHLSAGLSAISSEESNAPVVQRFVRFATALAVIPFAVYLATSEFLRTVGADIVLPAGISPPLVSGIAAVLTVNLITALFALLAVREQFAATPPDPAPVDPSVGDPPPAAAGREKTE